MTKDSDKISVEIVETHPEALAAVKTGKKTPLSRIKTSVTGAAITLLVLFQ
jgi:hypothetical protein